MIFVNLTFFHKGKHMSLVIGLIALLISAGQLAFDIYKDIRDQKAQREQKK